MRCLSRSVVASQSAMRRSAASSRSAWALPVSRRLTLSCAASAPWSFASLSASSTLGEALVAGGEFAAQPADLVGLGRRATRFRLQGALGLLARRRAFAQLALRRPERRLDALKPLAQLAIVALGGGGGGGGRVAFRLRSGVTRVQAGVGVLDQRMLGFQLLQPRLAGLEFDQQVGQRRQQGVELLARPFGAGEPVADLLELGAQRLVAHADRLERPFDLAPWRDRGRDGGRKPRRGPLDRRLQFFCLEPKTPSFQPPCRRNPKDARGNAA